MKEATGELNMTIVTIIAITGILGFVTFLLPQILNSVNDRWEDANGKVCRTVDGITKCDDE